ncbi:MAG TPA: hypothetical protein VJ964_17195 [Balneolaceae bacterium]|nr:hypothetical protein [Balneolaceae bacterium]
MRSEYFKSRPSQIRGTKENDFGQSINWDRVVYLSLLAILGLVFAYYLFDYYMIIEGDGRVMANRFSVRLPEDVRIMDMYVEKGDSIQENDPLFRFATIHQNQSPKQGRKEKRQLQEKLMSVNGDIKEQQTKLDNHKVELQHYRKQQEMVKKEVKLGVSDIGDLRNIDNKIVALQNDIKLSSQRLETLREKESILNQWKKAPELLGTFVRLQGKGDLSLDGNLDQQFQTIKYSSPTDGVVERISKNIAELAYRSEPILIIKRKTSKILIQALFQQNSLEYVSRGDTMDVKFDNGLESKGVITDFKTPNLADWGQAKTKDINMNKYIVITLKPIDKKAFGIWEKHSDIGVTVKKVVL